MFDVIKSRKTTFIGHCLKRSCLLKDVMEVTVNSEKGRGQKGFQILDGIKKKEKCAGQKISSG